MIDIKETQPTSYNPQIKILHELKEKLESLAQEVGVSLNQYIMFMLIREVRNGQYC